MKTRFLHTASLLASSATALAAGVSPALEKPNIVIFFADDISAREIPVYGSKVWSPPKAGDTSDPAFRAKTPVLDKLAAEGCWIKTAWAATVCSPSRAMMMTGRYAHRHKWWVNGDIGVYSDPEGKQVPWPLYESSPVLIGHVAQQAGYGTFWAGKTQMKGSDLRRFGFDEGCFTPGEVASTKNPYTDFELVQQKTAEGKQLINRDTGKPADVYVQQSWYWAPQVLLMNHPSAPGRFEWWPNTPEAQKTYGLNTYGPDVELEFAFEFMERQKKAGKPFFIYHTSHLGHDGFNWFNPQSDSKWPGTPVVTWNGSGYVRTPPNVTGDNGVYDTHGTVTESGIHTQINYIDYQIWLYLNKFKELGVANNTVFVFCADNGTSKYGKMSPDRQKGCHIPFVIYAPGMTKHGEQDILVNLSDILPTVADLAGVKLPAGYEIDGESLVPFLFTGKPEHREWIYSYQGPSQLIRGKHVMKDGRNKWWDVAGNPEDLISYQEIKEWGAVSEVHRDERERLLKILPGYDLHEREHDAPGVTSGVIPVEKRKKVTE